MHAREKGASMASNVQTLLVHLKTGPLQQPTELLKLPSEGFWLAPLHFFLGGRQACGSHVLLLLAGKATWQALIIPGNPGVAAFYKPLMQGLWKSLGGLVDVFCISQLGHNPQCHKQHQVDHRHTLIRKRQVR